MLFNDGDAYEKSMGTWSRLVGDVFIKWLTAKNELDWLDVGCGNGAFSELIVRSCFPKTVHAIDPSTEQIDFARTRPAVAGVAKFEVGDAMALPLDNNSFDIAVMALVIFFVPKPRKGLAEMIRVVRSGGTVASYTWDTINQGSPSSLIGRQLSEMGFTPESPPNPQVSEMTALGKLWSSGGLIDVESQIINVERQFRDIEEYWKIASLFPNIQKIIPALTETQIDEVKARLEPQLSIGSNGQLIQTATANAIKGSVP
jgi:ubiquinone/menaquinone biosynthesis C-methylase UbiE